LHKTDPGIRQDKIKSPSGEGLIIYWKAVLFVIIFGLADNGRPVIHKDWIGIQDID
jgi:hypothetical protein